MILAGARAASREIVQLKDLPDAPDFRAAPGREPHMKSLLLTTR
jgi:23S rRNA (cytosine1962-C5)-methyltransferase